MSTEPAAPAPFDAVKWWQDIATYLDTLPLAQVCGALGLPTVMRGGFEGPVMCPRHECRAPLPFVSGDQWACWTCGALGRGGLLFAAHIAGWLLTDGEDDDEVRRDFEQLAREVLFCGLIDPNVPPWQALYDEIPNLGRRSAGQRGIFEGEARAAKLLELAKQILKLDVPGRGIFRLVWAWNCTYCRPPLPAREVAGVMETALRRA